MSHPYVDLPSSAVWRRAVAEAKAGPVNFPQDTSFKISTEDIVVAAGSCFAQHIGRYLRLNQYNYLISEPPHPIMGPKAALALNYGVFSARYGNIYTPRQLLQLFDRAYEVFTPEEDIWTERNGSLRDPFRPNIQPGGYANKIEYFADRARHFEAVRRAFEGLDVFIFTFGLTEAWRSRRDGAVFPVCPGVSSGEFDPRRHEFVNFSVQEIVADFRQFLARLRSVNADARVVMTVSPVPLAATAEPRHVQVSTVVSKSILRIACDELERSESSVTYFPSYELITGPLTGKDFFGPDRRSVTSEGVNAAMEAFSRTFLAPRVSSSRLRRKAAALFGGGMPETKSVDVASMFKLQCDEEALDLRDSEG